MAEFLVVEYGVADKTGRKGGAVGERRGGRKILAEAEDEAVRAVVVGGAEESGHNHAGRNGAADGRVGAAREWEIDVVDDEIARRGRGNAGGHEARGMRRGDSEDGVEFGVRKVAGGLQSVVDFGGEILRQGDGGEAMEGAFPRAADGTARDDETEASVEADVDAADDAVGLQRGRKEMVEGDVDAVAGRAVDDPGGAAETVVGGDGVDGAAAGFGGADPALLGLGRDDGDGVAGGEKGADEFVEEDAVDAVIVGDEEFHSGSRKHWEMTKGKDLKGGRGRGDGRVKVKFAKAPGVSFGPDMTLRALPPVLSVSFVLALAGCATAPTESSEAEASSSSSTAVTAVAAPDAAPAPRAATDAASTGRVSEMAAVATPSADVPRSTWRAEREARAASAGSSGNATSGPGESREANSSEAAKLAQQLGETAKELATLRAANAKLRAERAQPAKAVSAALPVDPADEKLSVGLKSYAAFKQEIGDIFSEVERVRQENAELSSNLKTAVEQADRARAASSRLEEDRRAEQKARAAAEKNVVQLREQLREAARAGSAAGLRVEKRSGSAEPTGKR